MLLKRVGTFPTLAAARFAAEERAKVPFPLLEATIEVDRCHVAPPIRERGHSSLPRDAGGLGHGVAGHVVVFGVARVSVIVLCEVVHIESCHDASLVELQ